MIDRLDRRSTKKPRIQFEGNGFRKFTAKHLSGEYTSKLFKSALENGKQQRSRTVCPFSAISDSQIARAGRRSCSRRQTSFVPAIRAGTHTLHAAATASRRVRPTDRPYFIEYDNCCYYRLERAISLSTTFRNCFGESVSVYLNLCLIDSVGRGRVPGRVRVHGFLYFLISLSLLFYR